MVQIDLKFVTTSPPEAVLDTLRETSPEVRHQYWSNVTPKYFKLNGSGPDFIDVTEATFLVGRFWERSRYDWSESGHVVGTVLESNVFKPGSTWDLGASPREGGGSDITLRIRRRFQPGPKGRIAATINHLGGHRLFAWYLRSVLKALEDQDATQ